MYFCPPHIPVSALGITVSVSVKSLLPGTIKGKLDLRILPVKIQMVPWGAAPFMSPQSIAGSSVPLSIINCDGGAEGQAGRLFPLL